jgi:hypothetical protein
MSSGIYKRNCNSHGLEYNCSLCGPSADKLNTSNFRFALKTQIH